MTINKINLIFISRKLRCEVTDQFTEMKSAIFLSF